jgi:hypothetical protein
MVHNSADEVEPSRDVGPSAPVSREGAAVGTNDGASLVAAIVGTALGASAEER